MKFSLLRESMGNFAFWFLSDISATRARIHTKFYFNVCLRAPSRCGVQRPLGRVEGELKTQKMGVVSFVHRTATCTISVFPALPNVRTFWYRTVKIGQGDSTGWAKKFEKKIRIFHHFQTLRPYISETIKTEAYKQRAEKRFIPPLSNCRMCMDGPIAHGVLHGGPKFE